MLSPGTVLIWLLVMPPTGALLSLLGAAVIQRLPAAYREEAAPAPHHLAGAICMLCLALEGVLGAVGLPAVADFRWTPSFAQFRLYLDAPALLFLPVVTLAGLLAVVVQARRGRGNAWENAMRQAPVLLGLATAQLAVAAGDLYLLVAALGAALVCAWWAAVAMPGGRDGQHQALSVQVMGLAAFSAGVCLVVATAGESYLPSTGIAALMSPAGGIRAAAVLVGLGMGLVLGAVPRLGWARAAGEQGALYLPAVAAAGTMLVRVPLLATPHFFLPALAPLVGLAALVTWGALGRAAMTGAREALWAGWGAATVTAALTAWLVPAPVLPRAAATTAAMLALWVGLAAAGQAAGRLRLVLHAMVGGGGALLVGIPLAWVGLGQVGGWGWLCLPLPVLMAVACVRAGLTGGPETKPAQGLAALAMAGVAAALCLQATAFWMATPHLPGVLP